MANKTVKKEEKGKEKETDGHGVYSMTIIYSLVNEALNNHNNQYYRALYDSVYTLCNILDNKNSIRYNSIKENLHDIFYKGINIKTVSGEIVKISSSKILIAGCYSSSVNGVYCELIRDINGNVVSVMSDDLLMAYDFIGRLLYESLFDILQSKNIELPESLYTQHKKEKEE